MAVAKRILAFLPLLMACLLCFAACTAQFFVDRSHDGTPSDYKKMVLENFEAVTNNAGEVQTWVLDEILSRNAHVEYLQRHGLNGQTDRESFKKLIPVVTYEDIKPDIDRIANGDTSPILCGDPITEFYTSSVTSGGEVKLIPGTADDFRRRGLSYSLLMPVMNQYAPGIENGKSMYFMFTRSEAKTPGGLVAQTIVTSYHKSSSFLNRPFNYFTSPNETVLCLDSTQSMYSQLLCALVQNQQVVRVGAPFASGFIRAIQFLQKNWTHFCNDIRTGTVNPEIITDSSVKEAVLKVLEKPNPELADFIEKECGKDWKGIITRLWPNTKFIEAIVTGSMSIYIPTLDYYSNGLPLVCTGYASTECHFGFNLKPLCKPSEVSYTFIPNLSYFEFIPISMPDSSLNGHHDDNGDHQQQDHELVDLVNVKLGQEYEPVVTTFNGLYRYRVGDVVRVTGFKNKAPQFSFVCRRNVILSIDSDKTDEVDLQNAVANAINNHLQPLDITLVDYTSYADLSTNPGHYVIYWELRDINGGDQLAPPSALDDCCLTIEESLNNVYRIVRASNKSLGPLEIKIVEAGTFDKLMEYAISRGSSMHQYKTPRCIKTEAMVELMNSRVVSNYFSQKLPKYVAGHKDWVNKKPRPSPAPAPVNSTVECS